MIMVSYIALIACQKSSWLNSERIDDMSFSLYLLSLKSTSSFQYSEALQYFQFSLPFYH